MKLVFLALFVVALVLADDKYKDLSEDFNLAEVLENERLLNSYVKCLLSKGPCTPEVKQVKGKITNNLQVTYHIYLKK